MKARAATIAAFSLAALLTWVMLTLPAPTVAPRAAVAAIAGIDNPVTVVLLLQRAYDTLLEVAVLLIAVLAARSSPAGLTTAHGVAAADLLAATVRALLPVMVLVAAYLLWAGTARPGGAFQAGAVLGAAGVLLHLAGLLHNRTHEGWFDLGLIAGLLVFLVIGMAGIPAGSPWLGYPLQITKALVVTIEIALTLSIALSLLALFASGTPGAGGEQRSQFPTS